MRLRRLDRPGMEVKNDCTGCLCHELPINFGAAGGCCEECGCPKTPEAFDLLARPIPEDHKMKTFPPLDPQLPREEQGIYEKFRVERTDGSSASGQKHDGCAYFVLDMTHDPFAVAALLAYADACADRYPVLARELRARCER